MSKDEKKPAVPENDLAAQLKAHQAGEDAGTDFAWMNQKPTTPAQAAQASKTSKPRSSETSALSSAETSSSPSPSSKPAPADSAQTSAKQPDKPNTAARTSSSVSKDTMRAPATLPKAARTEVPTHTTMIAIRPDEDEVNKRMQERARAAELPAVLPRIWQIIVAVSFPLVLIGGVIRLVASPYFSWIEYFRPGFPADMYGFSSQERLNAGAYVVDYINNLAGREYLAGLKDRDDQPLFKTGEVSHMADVKTVYAIGMLIAFVMVILMVIGIIYLARKSPGGVRRSLFAGSIATLVIIIAVGVFAGMGFEAFFTDFHKLLFANGSWTFAASDTLIRLYPEQFWIDSALSIGITVFVVSAFVFVLAWPTKRRRELVAAAKRKPQGRRAAE